MDSRGRKVFLLVFLALFCPTILLAQPPENDFRLMYTFSRIGMWMTPINEEFTQKFCVTTDHGMLLVPTGHLGPGVEFLPSELRPWDIVVKAGETEVRGMADLVLAKEQKEIGLTVLREGKPVSVTLAIMELPGDMFIGSSSKEGETDSSISLPRDATKETVYYQEGEGVWGSHTLLEEGHAVVHGNLVISGKPVEGVNVSLFLAGKKRTQPATTDADGRFEISLPSGKYFYIGYALYGPGAPNRKMVPIDKNLAPFSRFREEMPSHGDCDEVTERFEELSSKHGPEVAAEMIAEEFEMDMADPFTEKYPLDLRTRSRDSVPDIVYNEPIKIVAPLHNTKASLNRLIFAWVPYEGAASYFVRVTHIRKSGNSTTYRPICEATVHQNFLEAGDLECEDRGFMDEGDVSDLVPGERYGLKVYAFDKDEKLLSASSRHSHVEFFVQ